MKLLGKYVIFAVMTVTHIRYKNYNMFVKECNGALEYPFTFYVKNNFNEMVDGGRKFAGAYLTRELCVVDAKLCVDKIVQERQG